MVHIQIISDLHIEQLIDDFIDPLNFFTPNADLLQNSMKGNTV